MSIIYEMAVFPTNESEPIQHNHMMRWTYISDASVERLIIHMGTFFFFSFVYFSRIFCTSKIYIMTLKLNICIITTIIIIIIITSPLKTMCALTNINTQHRVHLFSLHARLFDFCVCDAVYV